MPERTDGVKVKVGRNGPTFYFFTQDNIAAHTIQQRIEEAMSLMGYALDAYRLDPFDDRMSHRDLYDGLRRVRAKDPTVDNTEIAIALVRENTDLTRKQAAEIVQHRIDTRKIVMESRQ